MTRLAFDIYPPPVTSLGSRLVRLTNQHYAGGTTYIHGRPMGQGTIVVEKGNSWVTATNFAVGNYVIVRDLDISEVSDSLNVLGGFFLEEGDFLLVSDDPKVLTFSGRSTIVILERAILGPEALSEFAGPNDIIDGYWRWGSDTYGGVMRRAIYEANLQTPAGLPMIDTNLIGSDSVKWDDAEDSNGVAWPAFAGEYRTQCGTTLLELYRELYGYGVELEIDARTFDIYAYNPDGYGTDRTSATFATGKVRFVAGVNIAADLSRQIRGTLRRTHLLVRTTDWPQGAFIESDDYTPGDPVYKGVYQTGDISGDPSASTVIQSRAQRNMDLRTLSEDAVRIPLNEPGDDEANGRYTPGPNYTPGPTATTGHFWTGDLITLDTGDHTMDYQDASKRVEAVEYVLREAGDWQAIVHLGPRSWLSSSSIPPLAGAGSHTLPLELCDPTVEGSSGVNVLYDLNWEGGADVAETVAIYPSGTGDWPISNVSVDDGPPNDPASDGSGFVEWGSGISGPNADSPLLPATAGTVYRWAGYIRSTCPGDGTVGLTVKFYNVSAAVLSSHHIALIVPPADTWQPFSTDLTAPTGTVYMHMETDVIGFCGAYYDKIVVSEVTDPVEAENPYAGVSPKAARCDHTHPATEHDHDTDYAPLGHSHSFDDLNDVDLTTTPPTDGQVPVFDSGSGTWFPGDAGVTDHGALTGLDDDDHRYLRDRGGGEDLVQSHGTVGATETIDPEQGNWHALTLDANLTLTLTNPAASVGATLLLELTQDGSGGHTLTLPASVANKAELEAAYVTTASTTSFLVIWTRNTGTTWHGAFVGGGSTVGALDDLSDVTITSATDADRLRYNGSAWVNSNLHWEPMVLYDGTVMLDSAGNPHMHEVSH